MSHIDAIFDSVSRAQIRRQMEKQRQNPLPLLGMAYLPAGMIDMQLRGNTPELALYAAAHDSKAAEIVGVFVLNGLFDFPDWHQKGQQDEAWVGKLARIKRTLFAYRDELRARGCKSICLLENDFKADDSREILQYCMYVPNSIYYRTEGDKFWFEPNTQDQVTFLKFLIEKGHIDPARHNEMIINAFNARVLYLAQGQTSSRDAAPSGNQPK